MTLRTDLTGSMSGSGLHAAQHNEVNSAVLGLLGSTGSGPSRVSLSYGQTVATGSGWTAMTLALAGGESPTNAGLIAIDGSDATILRAGAAGVYAVVAGVSANVATGNSGFLQIRVVIDAAGVGATSDNSVEMSDTTFNYPYMSTSLTYWCPTDGAIQIFVKHTAASSQYVSDDGCYVVKLT